MKETFYNIKNPSELLEFIDKNIDFGWISLDDRVNYSTLRNVQYDYRVGTVDEILNYKVGICFEQVELQRAFMNNKNIKNTSFLIFTKNMIYSFLIYKLDNSYYWIQALNQSKKTIQKYESLESLLTDVVSSFASRHQIKKHDKIFLLSYDGFTNKESLFDIKKYINSNKDKLINGLNTDKIVLDEFLTK